MSSLSLCTTNTNNTGELSCDVSRGVLKKIYIFLGEIGSGDYASEALLFAKLVANSKLSKTDGNKIFPINEAQDVASAKEANKEGSLNLGFKTVLLEGKPGYKVKIVGGGDLLRRLRVFNNKTVRVLEYDANGVLWGTKSGTAFKGFQAKLFFTGNDIATGQNVEEGVVEFSLAILSTSEYYDNPAQANLSAYNVEDIKALIDVPLSFISGVTNVHKIGLKIPGSNLVSSYNTFDEIGSAVAALVAQFSAKIGAGDPSTALTITSIVVDNTLKALTVTYDNTGYTAGTGNVKLIQPTPTQLDTGNVTNVELLSVTYPKV